MGPSCVPPDVRRRTRRLGVAAVLAMTPLAFPLSAADAVDQSVLVAMQSFLASPTIAHQYSGSRRLEASASGQRAWLDVQTDFTPASGLLYEVTAEGGSGYIRARVLRSLLDEEQRLIARGGSAGSPFRPTTIGSRRRDSTRTGSRSWASHRCARTGPSSMAGCS